LVQFSFGIFKVFSLVQEDNSIKRNVKTITSIVKIIITKDLTAITKVSLVIIVKGWSGVRT